MKRTKQHYLNISKTKVKTAKLKLKDHRTFRDSRIRIWRARGWTFTRIAEHFGIKRQRAKQICDKFFKK